MIMLKLKNTLSYSGIVSASEKQPIVTVESQEVADSAVETGYFEIVKVEERVEDDGLAQDDTSEDELHTKATLKKLNAEQQKEIIVELGGDPEDTKNEEERIDLILELQEQE